MEQLEVPAKFGYFWTITGDVQCVRRAGCSAGRWRMGSVGTRWGVTKERDDTGLVDEGCWVHYDRYKIKKRIMQGRREGGEGRVLVESQMMLSGRALGSEDLQGSRKVDYIYV